MPKKRFTSSLLIISELMISWICGFVPVAVEAMCASVDFFLDMGCARFW